MARYRIVKRPSRMRPGSYVYDIQERELLWWETISPSWLSIEAAEEGLNGIRLMNESDWTPKVVKEYD